MKEHFSFRAHFVGFFHIFEPNSLNSAPFCTQVEIPETRYAFHLVAPLRCVCKKYIPCLQLTFKHTTKNFITIPEQKATYLHTLNIIFAKFAKFDGWIASHWQWVTIGTGFTATTSMTVAWRGSTALLLNSEHHPSTPLM